MTSPAQFRPKQYPAPEFPPRRPALFSRTPPAVFPVLMGLLGLGLAARRGLEVVDFPAGIAELYLGAVVVLYLGAALAYLSKIARRPGVLLEDLRILPGRAGASTASLSILLLAAVLLPYSADWARATLMVGLAVHGALVFLLISVLRSLPVEARGVSPIWHLHFVGFIIGGITAAPLGMIGLAEILLWGTLPVAVIIWGLSVVQLFQRIPPAPLRPLLAIHLAPASLLGTVAALLDKPMIALIFSGVCLLIFLSLIAAVRWISVSGFSPLWGAFTFPLSAYASCLFAQGLDFTGMVVLIAALGVVPIIALRVLQSWVRGDLAVKTNAAQA